MSSDTEFVIIVHVLVSLLSFWSFDTLSRHSPFFLSNSVYKRKIAARQSKAVLVEEMRDFVSSFQEFVTFLTESDGIYKDAAVSLRSTLKVTKAFGQFIGILISPMYFLLWFS